MTNSLPINSDFCGKVPLHQTAVIQPHGMLLVVHTADGRVIQASENSESMIGLMPAQLLTMRLADLTSSQDAERLQNNSVESQGKMPLTLLTPTGDFFATAQRRDDFLLVETEAAQGNDESQSFTTVYAQLKFLLAAVESAQTTEEACRVAVNELKRLSGFDKVMVYRFDENWNGDVIAEAAEEDMEHYLGLRFPASDIPKQARDLYKTMPFRFIPSVDYTPVRLNPVMNPVTSTFTDLSDSSLRSVANVHLEYLRNMGVAASMSTRILHRGELWGLIACHHRAPLYLSNEMRSVFEMVSSVMTARIDAVQSRDELTVANHRQKLQAAFTEALYATTKADTYAEHLLPLLEADGVAVVMGNSIGQAGLTPSPSAIRDLVLWLQTTGHANPYHQPALPAAYEPAQVYAADASGLLALPVHPERTEYVLAFRKEATRTVAWGGNPSEALRFETGSTSKYHPRASFRIWQENVREQAIPWAPESLRTANIVWQLLKARQSNVG